MQTNLARPLWVFDEDMQSAPPGTLTQNHWHRVVRTRTLCGLSIRDAWTLCIGHTKYYGPALHRRCEKCQTRYEEKVGLEIARKVGMYA